MKVSMRQHTNHSTDLRRSRGEGYDAANWRAQLKGRLCVHEDMDTGALRFHELQLGVRYAQSMRRKGVLPQNAWWW